MADVVKYGIQIPNRVFVGGVAFDTKEEDLKAFFQQFGKIKECKIIKDNQSISRGFAFVTFECKHDAIQAQQKGTVFFNQKKLNLGPAIRQKGVIFNGAKEAGNEPVLSTGVYIHPSGYSYTVAPNGVWYFHNSDGTPPTTTPGTPPMAYTPTTMQKIQASQTSPTSTSANKRIENSVETVQENNISENPTLTTTHSSVPIYHGIPTELSQVNPELPYQHGSYYPQTQSFGPSNIQVAFQNMSIASHPTNAQGLPVPVSIPPTTVEHIPTDASVSTTSNARFNYLNEVYVPVYPNAKYTQQAPVVTVPNDMPVHVNGQRHFTFPVAPRADYIPMVNSSPYIYGDGQPAYFLPNYVDPSYSGTLQQIPVNGNSKKAYYYPKYNGKISPKKDANFMNHPFSNQVQLRPQMIQ